MSSPPFLPPSIPQHREVTQGAFVPPAPVLPCPTSIAPRPHPPWPREAPWGNSPFSSTKSCPVRCKRYCGHQGQRVTWHLEEGAKTDTKNYVSWELYLGIFWGNYMLNFKGWFHYPYWIHGNLRIQVPSRKLALQCKMDAWETTVILG